VELLEVTVQDAGVYDCRWSVDRTSGLQRRNLQAADESNSQTLETALKDAVSTLAYDDNYGTSQTDHVILKKLDNNLIYGNCGI
jgi:hypothetical protein